MAIGIKSLKEIESIRDSNAIVAKTLSLLEKNAKAGASLLELDSIAEDFVRSCGGRPSFKGLYGFPNAVCISVNEVIIHGIPTDYKLKSGDIVGFDVGVEMGGWYGDGAITVGVDGVSKENLELMECSKNALNESIDFIKSGCRFKELSAFLQDSITKAGFVPLRGFCGHGIGRKPHEEPEIPNYVDFGSINQGPKIRDGMVFCIEPMVCFKSGECKILDNKWSVVSKDGFFGSHHEHTVAIIDKKAVVLSEV